MRARTPGLTLRVVRKYWWAAAAITATSHFWTPAHADGGELAYGDLASVAGESLGMGLASLSNHEQYGAGTDIDNREVEKFLKAQAAQTSDTCAIINDIQLHYGGSPIAIAAAKNIVHELQLAPNGQAGGTIADKDKQLVAFLRMARFDGNDEAAHKWLDFYTKCFFYGWDDPEMPMPIVLLFTKYGLTESLAVLLNEGHVDAAVLARARDHRGNNAYHLAAAVQDKARGTRVLVLLGHKLREKANKMINSQKNNEGQTPLDVAEAVGIPEITFQIKKHASVYGGGVTNPLVNLGLIKPVEKPKPRPPPRKQTPPSAPAYIAGAAPPPLFSSSMMGSMSMPPGNSMATARGASRKVPLQPAPAAIPPQAPAPQPAAPPPSASMMAPPPSPSVSGGAAGNITDDDVVVDHAPAMRPDEVPNFDHLVVGKKGGGSENDSLAGILQSPDSPIPKSNGSLAAWGGGSMRSVGGRSGAGSLRAAGTGSRRGAQSIRGGGSGGSLGGSSGSLRGAAGGSVSASMRAAGW